MPWSLLLLSAGVVGADPPAEAKPPARLSLAAAGAKVAAYVRKQKPKADVPPALAVIDLTTDAVWDKLHVQVVKIQDDEIAGGESFVVTADRLQPIGIAFGGDGITSLAVADLGDDKPLLLFAFNWGSGEHRSQIGALEVSAPAAKEQRVPPANYSFEDYDLRTTPKGEIEVWAGKTRVGQVVASRKDGALNVGIQLADNLPEVLRKELR